MKYTELLGLPVWNKPETDVFDITQFNQGNQNIDKYISDIIKQINDLILGDIEIDLTGYVKEKQLEEYAKKTDLNSYTTITMLSEYARLSTLENYVLKSELSKYATLTQLQDIESRVTDLERGGTVIVPTTLESISAVYNQGSKIVYTNTSLNSLKNNLTVTGLYSDGSTETITDYTLSGTLTEGTSTITVSYENKTTTFNVTVTAIPVEDVVGGIVTSLRSISFSSETSSIILINLDKAPTNDQTVTITSGNSTYLSVNPTTLTFTNANYNRKQSVAVNVRNYNSITSDITTNIMFSSVGTDMIRVPVTIKAKQQEVTPDYMYYGRLSIEEVGGSVIQYNQITENMIKTGANITREEASTKGKTSMGKISETAMGDYVVIAVPASKGYNVTRDNGIGGKVPYNLETAGANGIDLTIDNVAYKLFGEILLSPAEIFIYID